MPFVVIALCWGVETLKNAADSSGCFGRKSTRRLEKCAVLAEFSASTAHFFVKRMRVVPITPRLLQR